MDTDGIVRVSVGDRSIDFLPRADLWARFAAAAMGVGDPAENTAIAAKAADRMLGEFDKRFPPAEEGSPYDAG